MISNQIQDPPPPKKKKKKEAMDVFEKSTFFYVLQKVLGF